MSGPSDPFSSWSARRRAVAEEAAAEEVVPEPAPPETEEIDEAEYLEAEGLSDPNEMEEGDDFSAFMKSGVPKALRQRALRRLWRLNPVLANVDGLVEYGEDYTDAATVVENLQTAYQVGKGIVNKVLEEDPVDADAPEPLEVAVEETADNDLSEHEDDAAETEVDDLPETLEELEPTPEPAPIAYAPTRRKMAFRFDA